MLISDYLLGEGVHKDHIITIALDDDLNVAYRDPAELSKYIRSRVTDQEGMFYIFIDEVQYAISREELKNPESIHLYNVLNGLKRLRNVDIYVAGSNSKMRSKDVMTAFRGQGDSVEVHPLSFQKYYGYVGVVDIFETDAEGKRRKVSCEIDFVVNKGVKKSYIQSALSLGNAQKEKKELRPLLGVKDFFRKIIVTKSGMKPWLDEAGILHLRLYEFLLNPAALDL